MAKKLDTLDLSYFTERTRIDENGCWIWRLAIRPKQGVGIVSESMLLNVWHEHYAHRLAYLVLVGDIPEGDEVRHTCEVTACCNPDHLYLSPNRVIQVLDLSFFTERTRVDENGCWVWQGSLSADGYGKTGREFDLNIWREQLAHRLAYRVLVGDIPDEYEVDHICRNRPCCNPDHLQLKHGDEHAHDNGHNLKTHCPAGHPYSGDNLLVYRNHRYCKTCQRERDQRKRDLST